MKVIIATCLLLALFGWGDASKVESLVYEDFKGTLRCRCCSEGWHCPLCMTAGDKVTCQHACRRHTKEVRHSIKKISAKRKRGVADVWISSITFTCPQRGDVTGLWEWSYRNGVLNFIRKVED